MIYNYRIYGSLGTVDAEDVRDALRKSLAEYLSRKNPPYLSEEFERLDIRVQLIKETEDGYSCNSCGRFHLVGECPLKT